MKLSENSQVALLLTMRFSEGPRGDPTPLTPTEFGQISRWLQGNGYEPKDLFSRTANLLREWSQPKGKVTRERLEYLLGRGAAMGLALEKWASAGIWIITRTDPEYPERLKQKLGDVAPAVLLGVGDQRLLKAGGLAIVGSRNVDSDDQDYTRRAAESAANAGLNVISGGARGVDETAMLAALNVEGTATGVLANGLLSAALSGKWRPFIKRRDLCLVSTYYPEAPFQVGNAMGRNKYIYSLADYALAVRSEKGKGGTWSGATEALKKQLAPIFVRPDSNATGNPALIELGANPLAGPPEEDDSTGAWLTQALAATSEPMATEERKAEPVANVAPDPEGSDLFFRFFVEQLKQVLRSRPEITLKELKERYGDLTQKQITDWLGRAVEAGLINRRGKAHRYSLGEAASSQQSLFSSEEG